MPINRVTDQPLGEHFSQLYLVGRTASGDDMLTTKVENAIRGFASIHIDLLHETVKGEATPLPSIR